MNLNIQIPDNTALIFEYMQKGQFICSNSTDIDLRDMYNMIDENYESLYQYFSQINYTLERGNEFFYFSRTESKTTLEQKILRAYYWIDVLDFFKTYDETFGAGFRFQPEQILVEANINVLLQNKVRRYPQTFLGQGYPQRRARQYDTFAGQRIVYRIGK